jgi:hypothetical protein
MVAVFSPPLPRPGTIKPARTLPYTETPYYHVFKTTYAFIHKILQAVVKLLCDRTERIMILKPVELFSVREMPAIHPSALEFLRSLFFFVDCMFKVIDGA